MEKENDLRKQEIKEMEKLYYKVLKDVKSRNSKVKIWYSDIKSGRPVFLIGFVDMITPGNIVLSNDRTNHKIVLRLIDITRIFEIEMGKEKEDDRGKDIQ